MDEGGAVDGWADLGRRLGQHEWPIPSPSSSLLPPPPFTTWWSVSHPPHTAEFFAFWSFIGKKFTFGP
jgi:hypothetical protein